MLIPQQNLTAYVNRACIAHCMIMDTTTAIDNGLYSLSQLIDGRIEHTNYTSDQWSNSVKKPSDDLWVALEKTNCVLYRNDELLFKAERGLCIPTTLATLSSLTISSASAFTPVIVKLIFSAVADTPAESCTTFAT